MSTRYDVAAYDKMFDDVTEAILHRFPDARVLRNPPLHGSQKYVLAKPLIPISELGFDRNFIATGRSVKTGVSLVGRPDDGFKKSVPKFTQYFERQDRTLGAPRRLRPYPRLGSFEVSVTLREGGFQHQIHSKLTAKKHGFPDPAAIVEAIAEVGGPAKHQKVELPLLGKPEQIFQMPMSSRFSRTVDAALEGQSYCRHSY
jgi:hypothetical protein